MRTLLNHGELVVVETDDDLWLGTAEVAGDTLVVRSGYVGRPVVLDVDDVVSVVPAVESQDVDSLDGSSSDHDGADPEVSSR